MSENLIIKHYIKLSNIPRYLLVALSSIAGYILYFISFFIPRKKNIWIFGSWGGKRFSDNSKYLFLYVANNHKSDIKSIWISKDKKIINELRNNNYCAFHAYELRGIYYNLVAKYIFSDSYFNSVNFWCCGGATRIQLWHGLMLKKIEHDARNLPWHRPFFRFFYYFLAPWILAKNDYVLSSSDMVSDIFSSAFCIKKEKIILAGLPRNDIIFNSIHGYDLLDKTIFNDIANIKLNYPESKLILYMPTFRDSESKDNINVNMDLETLNSFLENVDGFILMKFHPTINMYIDYNKKNRIIFLPGNLDIYPILNKIDILITDYSSIYLDFLFTGKPIIFYPYDLNNYLKQDRDLYFDYNEFTPGPKAFTFSELLNWINYFINDKDDFIDFRKKIKDKCFKYDDGKASYRVYNSIKKIELEV
ncbi:MAG TPA: CDP-glycerol glycerophosphotransferase family protein [Candidatus Methanoperedens sp.]